MTKNEKTLLAKQFEVGGTVVYDGMVRGKRARHVGVIERLNEDKTITVDFGLHLIRFHPNELEAR